MYTLNGNKTEKKQGSGIIHEGEWVNHFTSKESGEEVHKYGPSSWGNSVTIDAAADIVLNRVQHAKNLLALMESGATLAWGGYKRSPKENKDREAILKMIEKATKAGNTALAHALSESLSSISSLGGTIQEEQEEVKEKLRAIIAEG